MATAECTICREEYLQLKLIRSGCCTAEICRQCYENLEKDTCPVCSVHFPTRKCVVGVKVDDSEDDSEDDSDDHSYVPSEVHTYIASKVFESLNDMFDFGGSDYSEWVRSKIIELLRGEICKVSIVYKLYKSSTDIYNVPEIVTTRTCQFLWTHMTDKNFLR